MCTDIVYCLHYRFVTDASSLPELEVFLVEGWVEMLVRLEWREEREGSSGEAKWDGASYTQYEYY